MMENKILLGHGSGGKLMNQLINDVIRETFGKDHVQLDDSALLDPPAGKLVFTTDSFTITPIFFRGGNIGSLAVNGTVNDLAVMGAKPLYLSCGLIIEEGLDLNDLRTILQSMREAADEAGVKIVTGDTKVVEKGKGDKIFINTSGIGVIENEVARTPLQVGDAILVNGTIGDHGISIMAERNGLTVSDELTSDCASLNGMIQSVMEKYPDSIRFMRDATRGGVASVLNEIVQDQTFSVQLKELDLPVNPEVSMVCDILGIDPLYAANEGKVIMAVKGEKATEILEMLKKSPFGAQSAQIGTISTEHPGRVFLETAVGGHRMLPLLLEDQLPRIC